MTRDIGVAHLTLLSLTPPELVETAAAAGFGFVGVRVRAVTATERAFDLSPGSALLAETRARLHHTGVVVRDVEFLPLTGGVGREDWLPALEAGAALGASVLTVTGADPERARLIDTLARLTEDAAAFGIRPAVEAISYQPVSSVSDAADLARVTGAAVMIDPLHLWRGGSSLADVRAVEPSLIPVVQLCDAPAAEPETAERVAALQREARAQRLLIGEGGLPLAAYLRATPPGTPLSLEIPHARLQLRLSPLAYARRVARSARRLLAALDEDDPALTPALSSTTNPEGNPS